MINNNYVKTTALLPHRSVRTYNRIGFVKSTTVSEYAFFDDESAMSCAAAADAAARQQASLRERFPGAPIVVHVWRGGSGFDLPAIEGDFLAEVTGGE